MCECYVKVAEAFPSSMRGSMCKLEKMNLVCSGNSSVELKGKFRQRPNCLYLVRLQTVLYPSKQLESLFAVSQTGGNVRFSYV